MISLQGKTPDMRMLLPSVLALTSLAALSACGGGASDEQAAPELTGETAGEEAVEEVSSEPVVEVAFADLTGDAAAGEAAYARCRACHMLTEDGTSVGPTLYGVVGRPAGSVAGYNYSAANGSADVVWSGDVLFEYLAAPSEFLPGTRMMIPGIVDPQERADLIAFLEANAAQ